MSIDAVIHSAAFTDKGATIYLKPREKGGCAGQRSLVITNWPQGKPLSGLVGIQIWGGSGEGCGQIVLIQKAVEGAQ